MIINHNNSNNAASTSRPLPSGASLRQSLEETPAYGHPDMFFAFDRMKEN